MTKQTYTQIAEELASKTQIEAALAVKAWESETFKQELMTNPRAVLSREIDGFANFPANVNIKVVEESVDTVYFVLPAAPIPAVGELSEEQLELVAGGAASGSNCCGSSSWCCTTLAAQ